MLSILQRSQEHIPYAAELLHDSKTGQNMEGSWRGKIGVPLRNLRESNEELGYTNFLKTEEPPHNSRRQNGDVNQTPY